MTERKRDHIDVTMLNPVVKGRRAKITSSRINAGLPLWRSESRPFEASEARHRGTVVLSRGSVSTPLALLLINSGPDAHTTLPLIAGVHTLGRAGGAADLPIDDETVSDRHLSIRYQDGHFTAISLDAANGAFVNGKQIGRQTLQPNDEIRVGQTNLVFIPLAQNTAAAY
jgi:FHA domain-containing protein